MNLFIIKGKFNLINTETEYDLDLDILQSNSYDIDRKLTVKKIQLETEIYNAFRNYLKIILKRKVKLN